MKTFHENRFQSIQALRGIAIFFVILEHIRFLNCGAFGVDIFFCISGFMIMFSTHTSGQFFIRKRALRILPLYYLVTIGVFALLLIFPSLFEQTKPDFIYLVKSMLFIPFDIGNGILQPIVRIGWTVNCEVFFYLLFYIAMRISHKYRGLLCSCFLCAMVFLTPLFSVNNDILTFYSNPVLLEFVFGILTYYICMGLYSLYEKGKLTKYYCIPSMFVTVILFVVLISTKQTINVLGYHRPLLWGIPAVLIVLSFFLTGLFYHTPAPLSRLGDMSYSLYLIHYYPVMFLDRKIFHFDSLTTKSLLGVVICIVLCLILSYFTWLYVEKGLAKLLQK